MFQGAWFSVVVLQGRGVSSIARILVCQDDIETPFVFPALLLCSNMDCAGLRSNSCLSLPPSRIHNAARRSCSRSSRSLKHHVYLSVHRPLTDTCICAYVCLCTYRMADMVDVNCGKGVIEGFSLFSHPTTLYISSRV